jgi:hypothetical protein
MRVASRRVRALPHTGGRRARTPPGTGSEHASSEKNRQKRLSPHDQKARMFTMNSSSELSAILFLLYKNAALIAASTVSCGIIRGASCT